MSADPVARLFETVVEGDYCIGCGLCAAVEASPIQIGLTEEGAYRAELSSELRSWPAARLALDVCPFSDTGRNEDEIAESLFAPAPYRGDIGYHLATYAGHVVEGDYRSHGSSGGMAKWILSELLRTGLVDHVVHVKAAEGGAGSPLLFAYDVDTTLEGVQQGSRAAYYPVEMSAAIRFIRDNPGRYAITGVPCFVKGLRRFADVDDVVAERVAFTVGIICGHLKTTGYAESLAWQLGVPPPELAGIDFRTKIPGRTAREKGVSARDRNGRTTEPRVVQELFGTKYPHGFFKYNACNFCDDVLAETADVAVGDAWLPEYVTSGNSVVVVRSPVIADLIEDGIRTGRLELDAISADRTAATQAGGLRDRRQGLAYRLLVTQRTGRWHPPKRVRPSARTSVPTRMLYRLRMVVPARSITEFRRAKERGDLDRYVRRMSRWTRVYDAVLRAERLRRRAVRLLDR